MQQLSIMISLKRIGTFALLLLVATIAAAQTIMWSMAPTDYSGLEYIGFEMFKANDNNKACIIDATGNNLTRGAAFDELTPFYDNWALLLSNQSGRKRVIGCISVDKICNIFPDDAEYYAIDGQAFFSCGLMTVENRANKKGYIDEEGELVIDFASGYDKIMPFSEDFAAVFKNNRYILIDKLGEKVTIVLPRVGEIRGGTNVYNGKALVWDASGHYYNYDVKQKACSKASKPAKDASPDYLYRLTDKGNTPPYMAIEGRKGLDPISSQGKYGYAVPGGGKTLIPCQLLEATPFIDNLAIAKTANGKTGILRYSDYSSGSFDVKVINEDITYSAGETVTCKFGITVPDGWRQEDIEPTIEGVHVISVGTTGTYSFKYKPNEQHRSFTVNVVSGGLTMYTSAISYDFNKKGGKSSSSKANDKGSTKKETTGKKDTGGKKPDKKDNNKKDKSKDPPKKPERL